MEVAFDGGVDEGDDYWKSEIGIREELRMCIPRILLALNGILAPGTSQPFTAIWEVAARLEERIFILSASKSYYDYKIAKMLARLNENTVHHRNLLRWRLSEIMKRKQQRQVIQPQGNLQETLSTGNCCDDRISMLHENMLHHIMSFLSARDVLHTCVLSPRWRSLWTSAPFLDIDINHFGMNREKFNKFAQNLFIRRGTDTLDTLRLHSFAIDAATIWINHAIKCKVRSIEFTEYIRWQPHYLNPHDIDFSSPYLRSLKLTNVVLVARVFDPLNDACPTLENLQLVDSILDFPEISSRSLKTLEITDCSIYKHILIRTHKLVSLCFKGSLCTCTLKSILICPPAITLFDLSNANSIELSAPVRQVVFNTVPGRCATFINVTSLSLGEWCLSDTLSPLICFLKHAPMLEKLTLKLKMDCEWDDEDAIMGTLQTVNRLSIAAENLKKVIIYCSEGDERVPFLENIFQVNVRSLEFIQIKEY